MHIGSDKVTFGIHCFYFFTTPGYFTPGFVMVPYFNGILQQYYGKYKKNTLVTAPQSLTTRICKQHKITHFSHKNDEIQTFLPP